MGITTLAHLFLSAFRPRNEKPRGNTDVKEKKGEHICKMWKGSKGSPQTVEYGGLSLSAEQWATFSL